MTATARVLPDGSVAVTDNGVAFQPLSPEAVQAVAAKAQSSADAGQTRELTEGLILLAGLLAEVGDAASATVTVTARSAAASVDQASFALAAQRFPGVFDTQGRFVAGPVTLTQAQRTVTDAVTTALSTSVTSATANFNAYDQGRPIAGGSLPAGTTVAEVVDARTVTVSQPAVVDGAGVTLTIG